MQRNRINSHPASTVLWRVPFMVFPNKPEMPQDKRLIVTKAVVNQVQKIAGEAKKEPSKVGVFIEFIIPPIVMQSDSSALPEKTFLMPHNAFPKDGRTSVLIIPKVIALDCGKINKRHKLFDAVVIAESICKRNDEECEKKAVQVAKTFSKFVIDKRIVGKMPPCIHAAVANSTVAAGPSRAPARGNGRSSKVIVAIPGMDERESLGFLLAQGNDGVQAHVSAHGMCSIRVGHGGMTAGDICENTKQFISTLRSEFPHLFKYIGDFKLVTSITEPVRFAENSASVNTK